MLEIAVMIEGQNGLNWPRWQRIARLVEDAGFAGLFRSDHFTNGDPPDVESLELWTSLTWLASNTQRIEFGPLVSPFSFRHPVHTARMASAVDDLSQGRLVLGLGAGWNEREHHLFGFDLLEPDARFDRFQEGMEVDTRLLRSDTPVTFEGQYYRLHGATLRLKGFMIPMDQADSITQFALVPSLFACCYGQPPSVQHTIIVNAPKGKSVSYFPDEIIVEGKLTVEEKKEDGFVISLFEIQCDSVKPSAK